MDFETNTSYLLELSTPTPRERLKGCTENAKHWSVHPVGEVIEECP